MKLFYTFYSTLFLISFISCTEEKSNKTGWDYNTTRSGFEIKNDSLALSIKPLNINDTTNHFRGLFLLGESFFISGTDGKIPSSDDATKPLKMMVETVETGGSLSKFLAFDKTGTPIEFS